MQVLRLFFLTLFVGTSVLTASAQPSQPIKSQEISEIDGIPVLIKHLPEWERVRFATTFTNNVGDLRNALGERDVFDLIDFAGGTEAVTAPYEAGKLLIIEYTNPQLAADADSKFTARLAATPGSPPVVYRRIGNYSVFVFDAADQQAAIGLLEQVKYEKTVQWLGEDPYLLQKIERYFAVTSRDVAIATVLWIVGGLLTAIVVGVIAGLIFFQYRERDRASRTAFSDAGGLTRLNLDDLSEPIIPDRS